MNEVPPATIKKIRTLAQIAADLRQGEDYNITRLIPESAPFVEDIAEFWGKHFLGRGWRKRVAG